MNARRDEIVAMLKDRLANAEKIAAQDQPDAHARAFGYLSASVENIISLCDDAALMAAVRCAGVIE